MNAKFKTYTLVLLALSAAYMYGRTQQVTINYYTK